MSKDKNQIPKKEIIQKLMQARQILDDCLSSLATNITPVGNTALEEKHSDAPSRVDFSIPIRPFIKKYASEMSGPKKFTLILAHLTKQDLEKEVTFENIQKEWNKMKSILGGKFNGFYTGAAKEKDWVETKKKGNYNLRPSWKGIFK